MSEPTVAINIKVSKELYDKLTSYARGMDYTRKLLVIEAIKYFIEHDPKQLNLEMKDV